MSQTSDRAGTLTDVIAQALDVPRSAVTDDLAFRVIPEWDSLRHVELMVALEEHWGTRIDADLVLELTSVRAIKDFATRLDDTVTRVPTAPAEDPTVHRGLGGVYVDETRVSRIDGEAGALSYRGYPIDDLVRHSSFEETAFLLIHGDLPTEEQLEAFDRELRAARAIPEEIREVLGRLAGAHPVEAVRTGVSALAAFDPDRNDHSAGAAVRKGVRLIAQIPTLVADHHALRRGRDPAAPSPEGSHAAHVLSMLRGGHPASDGEVRTMDRALILLAEHGSNASAFAARVVIGTRSDLHSAITAAIAAFGGSLHGGAIEGVAEMVRSIAEPSKAAGYVRALRARNEPVLGLGHRLYRTEDPRAHHLRELAGDLSRRVGDLTPYLILEEVRRAMHPYTRFGVDVNVDFYAGLVFSLLGVPPDLLTPAFVTSRIVGWVAQVLEQSSNNVLIRPLLRYVGEESRAYPAGAAKSSASDVTGR
jgi:citrate synthase